jgi:hypothetical protein
VLIRGGARTFRRLIQASYPVILDDSSNGEKSEREFDRLISTAKVSPQCYLYPCGTWQSKTTGVCVHSLLNIIMI